MGVGGGSGSRPKLNILRLHDEKNLSKPAYQAVLAQAGINPAGMYRQVTNGVPRYCVLSGPALPGTGIAGVPPLTQAIHAHHAGVTDPVTLSAWTTPATGRPATAAILVPETRCLRGVMGNAVASDGSMAIQCQNCHGSMADVGRAGRVGWLDEPNCQSCHSGTAVRNSGSIASPPF